MESLTPLGLRARSSSGPAIHDLVDWERYAATTGKWADGFSAKELARLPTKRKVVHGVVISPDSRYAFVTVEGVGAEPGTVEIVALDERKTVATVDTPSQAAGIDFWKID